MNTIVYKVDPVYPESEKIEQSAIILKRGGLVAFPTETVYGLGADTFNAEAVRRIFKVKQRPIDNPLIIHISSLQEVNKVAYDVPNIAFELMESFFPGPLTLILPRKELVPPEVSAFLPTIALRMPAHRIAIELIKALGSPIAAPSANRSTKVSPVTAEHVLDDLNGEIEAILDGGKTPLGIDSTVVNVLSDPPVILRPGFITYEELKEIIPGVVEFNYSQISDSDFKPVAPGMKYRHYTPQVPMHMFLGEKPYVWEEILKNKILKSEKSVKVGVAISKEGFIYLNQPPDSFSLGSYNDLTEVASRLYLTLREMEKVYDIILIEGCEEKGVGRALMNRLKKASTSIKVV